MAAQMNNAETEQKNTFLDKSYQNDLMNWFPSFSIWYVRAATVLVPIVAVGKWNCLRNGEGGNSGSLITSLF